MSKKIIINKKEYIMPKISIDMYAEYSEVKNKVQESSERAGETYTKEALETMAVFICKVYGNQFTLDELKNVETGLDAAGLLLEFFMIDNGVSKEVERRLEKIQENF